MGREGENAEAGWQLRRRKICFRCLREDKLVRQMITFWHDQGGKCNANKTRMKQMNWRNLPSCVPFILLVCLSTTDHTTQETRPTAGSTCRRETHLMPSYPDPAPRSPWRAHAAKRRRGLAKFARQEISPLPLGFRVAFAPEEAREGPAPGPEFCSSEEKAESGTTVYNKVRGGKPGARTHAKSTADPPIKI